MSFVQQLRERRVPQIVSAYAVGGWGLVQFVQFLEGRLGWSPHVLNLVALALVLLLPAVAVVAWSQGRPGRDRWGRFAKLTVPLNILAAGVLLFVLFQGKELRAVTTTVEVVDENGAAVERVVPRTRFLKRVMMFRPVVAEGADQAWLGEGLNILLDTDLSQDPFVETMRDAEVVADLNKAGLGIADRVPRTLQRKIARERHMPRILNGAVERDGDEYVLLTELLDTDSGRVVASHEFRSPDPFGLADQASRALREDLGVPAKSLAEQVDLRVAELVTEDPDAFRSYAQAVMILTDDADWERGLALLEEAVALDPTFALAHHLLSTVYVTLGRQDDSLAAERKAMAHLYRLPERVQFMIKAVYYINYETDMDKSLAVLDMWTRLYPTDADAYRMKAQFHSLRNDVPATIACYEKVLEIDPTQYETLRTLGNLHKNRGDFAEAERYLARYAEAFPTNARAWRSLASLHQATGDLETAEQVLEKAQTVDPNDGDTTAQLAGLYADRGWFDDAAELLDRLAENAENPNERVTVAEGRKALLVSQGRIGEALAMVEQWSDAAVHTLNPLYHAIQRLNHLDVLAETDRAAWALAQVDSAAGLVVPMVQPFAHMAGAPHLIALGRLDEAAAAVDAGAAAAAEMSLEVLEPRVNELRGRIARSRGDVAGALEFHRRAQELAPTDLDLAVQLGRALREAGRDREARELLEPALKRAPARGDLNLELALLSRQDPERARAYLETALATWRAADADYAPAAAARALAAELDALP